MTSTELALVTHPDEIAGLPAAQRGELITHALVESKQWLAVATKGADPRPIAEFKAWAATVAEMTKQKGLAEDIQLDALEMVRRAERGIGLAIRNGQATGVVAARLDTLCQNSRSSGTEERMSPSDFFSGGGTQHEVYAMTDGVTDDRFEESLTEAREEGSLSRANVIRKIRNEDSPPRKPKREGEPAVPLSRRLDEIAELASDAVSSRQMAEKLGHSAETIRKLARANGIDIPADRIVGKTHYIDPERVLREAVTTLQGLESGLNLLTPDDFDAFSVEQLKDWLHAVKEPARAVRELVRELNSRVRNNNNNSADAT